MQNDACAVAPQAEAPPSRRTWGCPQTGPSPRLRAALEAPARPARRRLLPPDPQAGSRQPFLGLTASPAPTPAGDSGCDADAVYTEAPRLSLPVASLVAAAPTQQDVPCRAPRGRLSAPQAPRHPRLRQPRLRARRTTATSSRQSLPSDAPHRHWASGARPQALARLPGSAAEPGSPQAPVPFGVLPAPKAAHDRARGAAQRDLKPRHAAVAAPKSRGGRDRGCGW
mmetsp:Transcript_63136/g.137239  ORF Transcript_63136/g.137239 Transcript_63136/m.137239 type:complete len:226 (+) Transcript_63136:352-1029(+)